MQDHKIEIIQVTLNANNPGRVVRRVLTGSLTRSNRSPKPTKRMVTKRKSRRRTNPDLPLTRLPAPLTTTQSWMGMNSGPPHSPGSFSPWPYVSPSGELQLDAYDQPPTPSTKDTCEEYGCGFPGCQVCFDNGKVTEDWFTVVESGSDCSEAYGDTFPDRYLYQDLSEPSTPHEETLNTIPSNEALRNTMNESRPDDIFTATDEKIDYNWMNPGSESNFGTEVPVPDNGPMIIEDDNIATSLCTYTTPRLDFAEEELFLQTRFLWRDS